MVYPGILREMKRLLQETVDNSIIEVIYAGIKSDSVNGEVMGKLKKCQKLFFISVVLILLSFSGCGMTVPEQGQRAGQEQSTDSPGRPSASPVRPNANPGEYGEEAYKVLNNNMPQFTKKQKKSTRAFEKYDSLDFLGRCGTAFANICRELMPTGKRDAISRVKPSGWHSTKYDSVDGKYLYNRCHLIGFQLAGENANEKNLITGTRYLNVEGMLPFENEVADYVKETGNHVLYRVTPQYEGDDLLAQGVHMEGYSVEDRGKGVCFNIFVYNVQPGIEIDYRTGDSKKVKEPASRNKEQKYIINTNTKKFHIPSCSSVKDTLQQNRKEVTESRDALIRQGYGPCGKCSP